MKRLCLPSDTAHPLPFYLAAEEWCAEYLPAGEYMFCWQVPPTVIIGRNQEASLEVDLDYCRTHDIEVHRRKSGGGCVYADWGNIMISTIGIPGTSAEAFAGHNNSIAAMLRSLGINAEVTGRNDIVVDEGKVSGNAFYRHNGRNIVHGTLLFDTIPANMAHAITPSQSKLKSNKVKSVSSRITTVGTLLPDMTAADLAKYAADFMSDSNVMLTDTDIAKIDEISRPYFESNWILGDNSGRPKWRHARVDNVGNFTLDVVTDSDIITDVHIRGDFFHLADISPIVNRLKGSKFCTDAILDSIADIDVSDTIAGLSNERFAEVLTANTDF